MWMFVFLILPLLGLAYVGWHVWVLLPLSAWGRSLVVALLIGSFLLLFCNLGRSIDRMPMGLARLVYDVGNSSVFVLLYLTMLFLVLDLLRLVRVVPGAWLHNNLPLAVAITLLMFVVFLYGNIHYQHKVREELHLTTSKQLSKPMKLVLMSDLHLGYHNPRKELSRWVDLVNAEKPDLVLIAGDIIDMSMRPLVEENMAEELRRIEAPVYACLGNHEYYSGEPEAQRFYQEAGIHLLRDTSAVVGDLCLLGRDDRSNLGRKDVAAIVRDADMQKYTILLDHQPYHLERTERAGIDFQFSGHTHYGQVWPISWITDAIYECAFGPHQRGNTRYYVSSGIGIWGGKFRIGTRSEYVVATLDNQE
jgi:predicted MPP superfamily phosphohydrolase